MAAAAAAAAAAKRGAKFTLESDGLLPDTNSAAAPTPQSAPLTSTWDGGSNTAMAAAATTDVPSVNLAL